MQMRGAGDDINRSVDVTIIVHQLLTTSPQRHTPSLTDRYSIVTGTRTSTDHRVSTYRWVTISLLLQSVQQRLQKRMTRFNVKTSQSETLKELCDALNTGGYTVKTSDSDVNERHSFCYNVRSFQCVNGTFFQVTISTQDRRKNRLTFKAFVYDMGDNILVDFRLSRVRCTDAHTILSPHRFNLQ